MRIKKKIFLLMIPLIFQQINFGEVEAAAIDDELAIISAEQERGGGTVETFTPPSDDADKKPEAKSRSEIRAEEKRLKAEKRAAEKRLKEEQKAARKKIKEGRKEGDDENKKPPTIRQTPAPTAPPVEPDVKKNPDVNEPPKVEPPPVVETPPIVETPPVVETPPTVEPPPQVVEPPPTAPTTSEPFKVGAPNPIIIYGTFEEIVAAVHFTPLYIPKKSGYTVNQMMTINDNLAEIRYGRRWEPEVSLHVRTYKRQPNEELKDISGVYGAKWRIDTTSGTTIYIAKLEENKHVAAWAAGNYTFSAYVENLSFAAFHSIVADELVDLSKHYYIN